MIHHLSSTKNILDFIRTLYYKNFKYVQKRRNNGASWPTSYLMIFLSTPFTQFLFPRVFGANSFIISVYQRIRSYTELLKFQLHSGKERKELADSRGTQSVSPWPREFFIKSLRIFLNFLFFLPYEMSLSTHTISHYFNSSRALCWIVSSQLISCPQFNWIEFLNFTPRSTKIYRTLYLNV